MRRCSTLVFAALAALTTMALPRPASAQSPAPYNWTGFYAGGNVGWMWSRADSTAAVPAISVTLSTIPPLAVADTTRPNGVIGGVQFGYDWQGASNWIAGFETDIQASGQSAASNPVSASLTRVVGGVLSITTTSAFSHTDSVDWFGTARGRLGYAIWRGIMVYGTGGLAYGRVSTSAIAAQSATACLLSLFCTTFVNATANGEASAVKIGWTAGGGVSGIVPNNAHLTWKVEYLHVDLGSINFTFSAPLTGVVPVTSRFTDEIVRVGTDYHF